MVMKRNARMDWKHDISGVSKSRAKVYSTRVPFVNSPKEKRFRGLGLVAS